MPSRAESALFVTFLALLVWAPLPFASNRVWGWMLLTALVAAVFAGWMLLYAFNRASFQAEVWKVGRWPLALLLLIQAWVLVQVIPMPFSWVAAISPQAANWQLPSEYITLSLDPATSFLYFYRGLALAMAFFLTLVLVNSQRRLQLLLLTFVLSGTFQAAYGSLMTLTGVEYGFFIEKYAGQGTATGTFVNRNHLAGYLVMCLAAGIGLMMSQIDRRPGAVTMRDQIRRWLKLLLSSKLQVRVCLAVMVVGLVLTRSRMGNVAFFSGLGIAGAMALAANQKFTRRTALFLLSLLAVDLLILGQWFGLQRVVERLEQTSAATEGRVAYGQPLLDYLLAFPFSGSGAGSFYGIFPNFQPPEVVGFLDHAHNDYMEFAVELGLPATALLGMLVLWAGWQGWRAQLERRKALCQGAGFAVVMVVVWMLLHSAVDFNLRIPANALSFCVLLAVAVLARYLPSRRELY